MSEIERIQTKYGRIFDAVPRYTPEQRAEVLWALNSTYCMGCGRTLDECMENDGDGEECCNTALVDVMAKQCPECETIHMSTVHRAPTETVEHGEDDLVERAADIFREHDRTISAWGRGEADLIEDREWARRTLALRSQEPVGWQPMETAPKDGTRFIAWDPHNGLLFTMHWDDGFLTDNELWSGTFTHWTPRPVGPPIGAAQ